MVMVANYFAIVPAAGTGQRMQNQQAENACPKQYLVVNHQTIVEHSCRVLLAAQQINSIVVCVADNDEYWQTLELAQHPKIATAQGGITRAHSVMNGLLALETIADEMDWVLVHDAARPCLQLALLQSMLEQLAQHPVGGILAVAVKDTLKLASDDANIERTVARANLWQAQTPQMFRYGLLKKALATAIDQQQPMSDEAAAMESAGFCVKLLNGDARNLKLTTRDDLPLIESILRSYEN